MATQLRIVKNQPFSLYFPCVMLNAGGAERIDASELDNVQVTAQTACDEPMSLQVDKYEQFLVIHFPATLKVAAYNVSISATYHSKAKQLLMQGIVAIVNWDYQSNWQDYIVGDHIELDNVQPFLGDFTSDAEYTALKAELRLKIAAAEAEKQRYEQKVAELENVALQGDDPTATNTAIKAAIDNMQGSNQDASLTSIQQLVINEGIPRADEYAQDIHNIIGDWSNE